jgi:hypothetical protein
MGAGSAVGKNFLELSSSRHRVSLALILTTAIRDSRLQFMDRFGGNETV